MINTDGKCLRCGGCVSVCPADALTLAESGITCSEKCTNCSICVRFCPMNAISIEDKGEK
jgi:ferredoxin